MTGISRKFSSVYLVARRQPRCYSYTPCLWPPPCVRTGKYLSNDVVISHYLDMSVLSIILRQYGERKQVNSRKGWLKYASTRTITLANILNNLEKHKLEIHYIYIISFPNKELSLIQLLCAVARVLLGPRSRWFVRQCYANKFIEGMPFT